MMMRKVERQLSEVLQQQVVLAELYRLPRSCKYATSGGYRVTFTINGKSQTAFIDCEG